MTVRTGALRRRRKPSLATRLRIFWVFIVTIAGGLAYGGYLLVTLPALRVHAIDVRIAGQNVDEQQVLQAAQIDRASNVWLLNTAQIAQRIEAIPYVDAASVQHVPPADLVVAVTERVPAACVRDGPAVVTVDAVRRILQTGCARSDIVFIDLPKARLGGTPGSILDAPALPALIADGQALRAADLGIRSISQDRFGQLVAVDTHGIRLLLGNDEDVGEKAKLVAPVLAAVQPGRVVRAIDLRAPATPTVEFR